MNTEFIRCEEIATPKYKITIAMIEDHAAPEANVTHGRYKVYMARFDREEITMWHDAREAADKAFDDLLECFALPLQAAFFRAGLKRGGRYTLIMLGDFGFPCAVPFTFDSAKCSTYAQYNDVVRMVFTPAKMRRARAIVLHNRSFLLYDGWRELPEEAVYNIGRIPERGIVTKSGKYASFDERYMDDIKRMLPDYIACYDHDRVYRSDESDREEKPFGADESFEPREIAPGLTLVKDEEGGRGLRVDMSPDMFASLYAEDAGALSAEDRLIRALRRAAVASIANVQDDDGGTCNLDAPTLDYAEYGMSKAEAEEAVRKAGFTCYSWKPVKDHRDSDGVMHHEPAYLVVCGFFPGQGNRRTNMAKAFCESLLADGIPSGMYYQMD